MKLLKIFLVALHCVFVANSVLATTYSADNPFANSQYTDIADLAQEILDAGYNIDNYMYSEGFSTGIDGQLGNEAVCFRDDTNQVYIGRSDFCNNRQLDSTYTYINIDQMDWSLGFPDEIVGSTGDIINDNNWTGCYQYADSPSWAGQSGGQCPNINTSSYQINFGYIQQTLSTIGAINQALQEAGVEVTGYTYSWRVKNADANFEDTNGARGQDPFYVTVKIIDSNNQTVFEKTYDYSYWIDNWTQFNGTETFKEPFLGEELSEIELLITGQDAGYWAGWYGPEFDDPSIRLNYRISTVEDNTVTDLLFNQMCASDPLYDLNCPGYNDAMLAQINASSNITDITDNSESLTGIQTDIMNTGVSANDGSAVEIDPSIAPVVDTSSTVSNDIASTSQVESGGASIEEAATAVVEPAQQSATSSSPASRASGLNANQLAALNAAEAASSSAESLASDAAGVSSGVGLSEAGGVGSSLTSVDPTGSTNSLGGIESQTGQDSDSNGQSDGSNSQDNGSGLSSESGNDVEMASLDPSENEQSILTSIQESTLETNELPKVDLIADIINQVTQAAINKAATDTQDVAEESSKESIEEQNAKEDELVAAALAGSDDEDAQAALLGYNPNFRQYQQPQLPDVNFYQPKEIYEGNKTYDNPNQRFFNGASDAKHNQMVRQQYERN